MARRSTNSTFSDPPDFLALSWWRVAGAVVLFTSATPEEFALLLPATRRDELGEGADRVPASLRVPLQLTSGVVTVTVSVGSALGAPGCTAEAQLQCADTAMYAAKRAGKNAGTLLDMAQAELVL